MTEKKKSFDLPHNSSGTLAGNIKTLLFALLAIYCLIFIFTLIAGAIIFFSNIEETFLVPIGILINVIPLLAGGYLAAKMGQNKGLVRGLAVGAVFLVLMLLINLTGHRDLGAFWGHCIYGLLASAIGGVFGVR
ncbi:MAG: TIGR04086 family membrane protein [Clostridiales bacterium]|jgi:putative membrane protein (TIGR04086 family)|nr:TIGR04086 family membrane protein [Clostridiales bacterium]MDR2713826.1 TIGR04086 family membrane protein [Clostridiales bacterium]